MEKMSSFINQLYLDNDLQPLEITNKTKAIVAILINPVKGKFDHKRTACNLKKDRDEFVDFLSFLSENDKAIFRQIFDGNNESLRKKFFQHDLV